MNYSANFHTFQLHTKLRKKHRNQRQKQEKARDQQRREEIQKIGMPKIRINYDKLLKWAQKVSLWFYRVCRLTLKVTDSADFIHLHPSMVMQLELFTYFSKRNIYGDKVHQAIKEES